MCRAGRIEATSIPWAGFPLRLSRPAVPPSSTQSTGTT